MHRTSDTITASCPDGTTRGIRFVSIFRITIPVVVGSLIFSSNANAYIDPGTGSLLVQGLIASVAAGLYTIKLYWYKIKKFIFHSEDKLDVNPDEDE